MVELIDIYIYISIHSCTSIKLDVYSLSSMVCGRYINGRYNDEQNKLYSWMVDESVAELTN